MRNCLNNHKLCEKRTLQQNHAKCMLEHTNKSILSDYVNKQKIDTFEREIMGFF